ncbi:hypothetical protein [Actinophytocola sediminis]
MCPVSFALKLAVFCLALGMAVGVWMWAPEPQPVEPSRVPPAQVADSLPGQP